MWTAITWFEIRYQLRQPFWYLMTAALAILLFIGGAEPATAGRLQLNAPVVIFEQLFKGLYLLLFLLTAVLSSAAVRDFDHHTAAFFFTKPMSFWDYLTGRFTGTLLICGLSALIGVLALAVSSLMPDLDPTLLGPFRASSYLFAMLVLILPTLLAVGALLFALAIWTRSTLVTYVGSIGLFALHTCAGMASSAAQTKWLSLWLDPLGITAVADQVKYWTTAQMNTTLPEFSGMLLWNRLLWITLGILALVMAVRTFVPTARAQRTEVADAAATSGPLAAASRPGIWQQAQTPVAAGITFGQLLFSQFSYEAKAVFRSWPFLVSLILGLAVLLQSASSAGNIFGMPVHPRSYLMLEAFQDGYLIILLLLIVVYSGELIWKERSLDLNEIIDVMPIPNSVVAGAKMLVLLWLIVVYLGIGVLTVIGYQLAQGFTDLQPTIYLTGVAIAAVYPALMLVLACCCHVLARSKLIGYGLIILFIISWDLLEELGFEHHLYRFASLPPTPWSDFNGFGPFLAPFGWYSLYWGLAAVVLTGLVILFWQRGTDLSWKTRWSQAGNSEHHRLHQVMMAGGVSLILAGSWIFYNTNLLNPYTPGPAIAAAQANYERNYRQFQQLPQPKVVGVQADVDIDPEQRQVRINGSYHLRHHGDQALHELHISLPQQVQLHRFNLPAHDVVLQDNELGYHIIKLRQPLNPGHEVRLGFELSVTATGFVNNNTSTLIVDNGSYFTKRDFFPVIGYDEQRQLTDADVRRQHQLEPLQPLAAIDDPKALRSTPRAADADRISFDITMSTSHDQIAVTSGELQRTWTANHRRYFHYRTAAAITHHFAFASARYQLATSAWNGIKIEVYYHPEHHINVSRILDAARKSLDYGSTHFGPYPHQTLRIVEFPRYVRDATSFPGLISFSEAMGFNARLSADLAIDYPFYVTAHEVAHQWWGQQLVGANVQGVAMLHESLAQYTALMVMEQEFGQQGIMPVLAQEHHWYLRGRAAERGIEPPLALVEKQDYVYYHKGALAMYALRSAVGEQQLNQTLAKYLKLATSREPIYSTTADFLNAIRTITPTTPGNFIEDWFEQRTLYDNQIVTATSSQRADGKYVVRLDLQLEKRRANEAGVEQRVPTDDWLDIAIYAQQHDGPSNPQLLLLERQLMQGANHSIELVVSEKPAFAQIDPYYKLIDRHREDNMRLIEAAAALPAP